MTPSICIAQSNFTVGDFTGNVQRLVTAAQAAHQKGACVFLSPELAICGYSPEDLLLRPAFLEACEAAVRQLAEQTAHLQGLLLVVGAPRRHEQGHVCNTLWVLREGAIVTHYDKMRLPQYGVFDEVRYFRPGETACVLEHAGVRWGLLICEDAWYAEPARGAVEAGAEVLLVANASPFHARKEDERTAILQARARECGVPLVYAHLVAGQDELVFDGGSFAVNAQGDVTARAPLFEEALLHWSLARGADASAPWTVIGSVAEVPEPLEQIWHALVLAVRDYVRKTGFRGAVLGMSGGIDSALVLAIAVDALGADAVQAVMMPSRYTADISQIDAKDMAERLGARYDVIEIHQPFDAFRQQLAPLFEGRAEDTAEENLQARVRGTLLMAISNKFGSLVLTTGNKSELATGYCTLYGDMAGGYAVIKDLPKTTVYALARWRNDHDPYQTGASPIPERIITRAPSAELRPDQKDQDSLPPYEVLDGILAMYMEQDRPIAEIVAAGYAPADVERVTRLIQFSEYKRRQAALGPRVTPRAFGKDWRYPLVNVFRA